METGGESPAALPVAHCDRPPRPNGLDAARLVSGLWSSPRSTRTDSAPSQTLCRVRWLLPSSALHYRCGGSAGISPASQIIRPAIGGPAPSTRRSYLSSYRYATRCVGLWRRHIRLIVIVLRGRIEVYLPVCYCTDPAALSNPAQCNPELNPSAARVGYGKFFGRHA
jgi:hypothetical protein